MKKEKFDEIYNNIIFEIKKDIDVNGVARFKPASDKRIFNQYQKERYKLKRYYMKNPNENIDRHKIASCIMYSIMKVYPIYIPIKTKILYLLKGNKFSQDLSYINEYIAVYTALSVLDNFYQQDQKDGKLDPCRHKIYIPNTFSDDYGFLFNMCIDLRFGKQNNKINLLTFSDIFFLLEYQHPFNNNQSNNKRAGD